MVLTVSQISNYIKGMFEDKDFFRRLSVEGEISSLRFSKHMYVTLKDGYDSLECIMYSSKLDEESAKLSIGDKVIFHGYIQAYTPQSKYSMVINKIDLQGAGDQFKAFEELKAKLQEEGLFDSKYKKAIPEYPKLIGVVTSETGAAFQDIIKTLNNKSQFGDVILFPTSVQGASAPVEIVKAIDTANEKYQDSIDVLIVGRGGGSPEDLAAFNDEEVARAIFRSKIPVISAVGHEIDISISDFVADMRAETPTAAANLAVKSDDENIALMQGYISDMNNVLRNLIIQDYYNIDILRSSLETSLYNMINEYDNSIEKYKVILVENNPLGILDKGYALVTSKDGNIVSSSKKMKSGEDYVLSFADGKKEVTAH